MTHLPVTLLAALSVSLAALVACNGNVSVPPNEGLASDTGGAGGNSSASLKSTTSTSAPTTKLQVSSGDAPCQGNGCACADGMLIQADGIFANYYYDLGGGRCTLGCPNVNAADFDQPCAVDSDCVPVGMECACLPFAAVNQSAVAAFTTAMNLGLEQATLVGNLGITCSFGAAVCMSGTCSMN
jgi:hypothetical protein